MNCPDLELLFRQTFMHRPWRIILFALFLFCCPDLQSKSMKVNLSSFMKSGRSVSECIRSCLDYCARFALLSNCKCKNIKVRGLKNLSDKSKPYSLTYPEGFEIK